MPVLMYHRIVTRPTSEFDRTPKDFLSDLERLYRLGYRPILARDLARGRIDVAASTSPVVLTFDDSSDRQFAFTGDGEIDPRSAIGMLIRFARSHPGFEPVATMFVNRDPFGSNEPRFPLRELNRRGFELGNHTPDHTDLSEVDPRTAERALRDGSRLITSAVKGVRVESLALPFGAFPTERSVAWRGRGYRHRGVFLVGAEPAPSPFSRDFDPRAIPRIRSGTGGYSASFWLRQLAGDPSRRFVSDGDPEVISFPKGARGALLPGYRDRARPY